MKQSIYFKGVYTLEHYRSGKLIAIHTIENFLTDEGIKAWLDGIFLGGTVPSTWYLGLIDLNGFTGVSKADTSISHSGWSEFTQYEINGNASIRAAFEKIQTINGVTARSVTFRAIDSNIIQITNRVGKIRGSFFASQQTKGNGGILLSAAVGPINMEVWPGDEIRPLYTLGMTSDVSDGGP